MAIPTNIEKILNPDIVENVRVELKEGWNPEAVIHTICAFANDIDNYYGGYIIIGINDNKRIVGFDRNKFDILQKEIYRYCKKCIEPNYIPEVDIVKYQNKDLVVLWCPTGNDRPYKCYENVFKEKKDTRLLTYIRQASLTVVASREDENELYNIATHVPFDDRVNYKYRLSDIDRNLVKDYLKESGSDLLTDFDDRDLKDVLLDLKAIGGPNEDLRPKNIALLMFTKKPHDYIPYSYIELVIIKDQFGEEITEKVFDSCLYKQYEDCMDYINNKILDSKKIKIEGEYKSKTVFNYSYEVLEEVISNALLHKSYQIGEPVTIRIEVDKIEVTNVPGFDRTISDTAIKELKPKSRRYQSRRIAEFLKELEIVEAKNTGYPRIIKKSEENGSPLPVIEMNPERDYVTVIIPINKEFYSVNESMRERIINALNEKEMTKTELCYYLGFSRIVNSVTYQLNKLLEENIISFKNKKYYLN